MKSKLALFFSACSIVYLFCVTFIDIPKENHRVVDTIIGFLMGTLVSTIINYYFGDSDMNKTDE